MAIETAYPSLRVNQCQKTAKKAGQTSQKPEKITCEKTNS